MGEQCLVVGPEYWRADKVSNWHGPARVCRVVYEPALPDHAKATGDPHV